MKRITLGQYYPGSSPLHRMDGRFRLVCVLLYMISTFLCKSLMSFLLLVLFTLTIIFVSRVPLGTVLKSVRMIIYILLITFVINVLFTSGDGEPLFSFWIIRPYKEGIWKAALMAVRILCLVSGSGVLISYTATPIDITHSLESLLSPLKKLHVPVHDFSMMMFIALRFIPTLSDDADKIMTAQMSRGVDFTTGSLFKRIKALVPILVPLFVSSFRRADELATAMECRCYHGGDGRTSMKVYSVHASDVIILILFIAAGAGMVLLNRITLGYTL